MVEGMALLHHAQKDSKFVKEWIENISIENLQMLENKRIQNIKIIEYVKVEAKKLSHRLKEKSQKDILQTGRDITYRDFQITKINMAELVKSLAKTEDHWHEIYRIYDRYSKWQHWNNSGIFQYIDADNNEINFREKYSLSYVTCMYGVFCFLQTSMIFNMQLNLKKEKALNHYMDRLIELFEKHISKK